MANIFTSSNAKAYFKFATGLLQREELSNDDSWLSKTGIILEANGLTTADAGSLSANHSAHFDYWDVQGYLTRTDDGTNLPTGFPLKNGEANLILNVAFWWKHGSYIHDLSVFVQKAGQYGSGPGFIIGYNADGKLYFHVYSSPWGFSFADSAVAFVSGHRHFVVVTFNGNTKAYRIYIWDLDNSPNPALLVDQGDTNTTITVSYSANNYPLLINRNPDSFGSHLDGDLDSMIIEGGSTVWDTTTIQAIRDGTYGTAAGPSIPVLMNSYKRRRK